MRNNKSATKTYSRKQSTTESSSSYYPNCIASITSNNNMFDSRSHTSKEDGEILLQGDIQSDMNADYQINEDHSYENVICSPNVMQITYNKDDEYILGDDYDDIQIDESVYDSTDTLPTLIPYERHNYMDTGNDTKLLQMPSTSSNLGSFIIAKHQSTKNSNTYTTKRRLNAKNTKNIKNYINDIKNNGNNSSNNSNDELFNPTPHAVVLRNPRSNQPRTYSTDSLYAALMDVKRGESIYRASQMHKVPRKTLRNWMKRWHIKSAYPMPSQLKQAAEKKRLKLMKESAALEALHIEKVNTRQCKN
uniref:HTH psq-type domain-containing protein n=1 Tax=Tabanus bromius TaxID=304241 RepID=A0A0K8TKT7_TABBR